MAKKLKGYKKRYLFIVGPLMLLALTLTFSFILYNRKSYASKIEDSEKTTPNILEIKEVEEEYLLSNNEYISNLSNYIEDRQYDNTIIYYADKFKLDTNEALKIARKLTNDYEEDYFKKNNVIAPSSTRKSLKFNSFEAGVVYFIRDLYRNPEDYGTSSSKIRVNDTVTVNTNEKNGILYMDNGLTFEQYLGKICDLYNIDKSTALAIVYEESGGHSSGLFKYSNNIGGLRGGSGWLSFPTLESGIISYVLTLRNYGVRYGFDLSKEGSVAKLSGIYTKGNINSYNESWTTKVNNYRNKINSKDLFTIK